MDRQRLITVAEDRLGQDEPVHIVRVSECRGGHWFVSPALRTVYYLAGLSPADMAHAIMSGVEALAAYDARPKLRLIEGGRADDQLAAG